MEDGSKWARAGLLIDGGKRACECVLGVCGEA